MRALAGIAGAALGVALASGPQARLYGSGPIERHLRQYGRSRQSGHSIADQPHEHKREIARRLRQAERIDANRHARAVRASKAHPYGGLPYPAPNVGLTRTGAKVLLRHYPGVPE